MGAVAILLLMFVPKIKYETVEAQKPSRNLNVSGLNTESRQNHSFIDDGRSVDVGRDSTSEAFGEKIITTKTAEELAEEVEYLQGLLKAQQKRDSLTARSRGTESRNSFESLRCAPVEKRLSVVDFADNNFVDTNRAFNESKVREDDKENGEAKESATYVTVQVLEGRQSMEETTVGLRVSSGACDNNSP